MQAGDIPTCCTPGNRYVVAKCCCTAEYVWAKISFSTDNWKLMAITFIGLNIKLELENILFQYIQIKGQILS